MSLTSSTSIDLAHVSTQLDSDNARDRLLALVSLRDVPAQDAVPLIKKVLKDEHIPLRSMAVFSLGIKQTDECYDILIDILNNEADYGIRADAAGALGYLNDPRAFGPLVRAFHEETDWLVRFSAAVSLGNLGNPDAFNVLMKALDAPEVVLQQAAIAALGEIGAVNAVDKILTFVQSDDWLIRQRLAEALGNMDTEKSRSALNYMTKDVHPHVAQAARLSLDALAARS